MAGTVFINKSRRSCRSSSPVPHPRGFSRARTGFGLGVYGAGSVAGTIVGGSASDRAQRPDGDADQHWGSAGLLVVCDHLHPELLRGPGGVALVSYDQSALPAGRDEDDRRPDPAGAAVMVTAMYRLTLNLGHDDGAAVLGVPLVVRSPKPALSGARPPRPWRTPAAIWIAAAAGQGGHAEPGGAPGADGGPGCGIPRGATRPALHTLPDRLHHAEPDLSPVTSVVLPLRDS